jgi:hypothetical protein
MQHVEEKRVAEGMSRDFCLGCGRLSKARCRSCWKMAWYFATHLCVFDEILK